jgi:hypothetical protein
VLDLVQLKLHLSDKNLREVARRCGVNYFTLHSMATGRTPNPHLENMRRVSDYLLSTAPQDDEGKTA